MLSVSMRRDRNTSADRRETCHVTVSGGNSAVSTWLSGERQLQFPDCTTDVGRLFPLKEKALSITLTKSFVPWVPTNSSCQLLTVCTISGTCEGWEPGR